MSRPRVFRGAKLYPAIIARVFRGDQETEGKEREERKHTHIKKFTILQRDIKYFFTFYVQNINVSRYGKADLRDLVTQSPARRCARVKKQSDELETVKHNTPSSWKFFPDVSLQQYYPQTPGGETSPSDFVSATHSVLRFQLQRAT